MTGMRFAELAICSTSSMRIARPSIGSVTCMRLAELVVARMTGVWLTLTICSVRRVRVAKLTIGSARHMQIAVLTVRSVSRGRLALCTGRTTDVRGAGSLYTRRSRNVAELEPRHALRLGGLLRRRGHSWRSYFRLDRSVAGRRRSLRRRTRNRVHQRSLANGPGRRRERATILVAIRSCPPTHLLSRHSSVVANVVDSFYRRARRCWRLAHSAAQRRCGYHPRSTAGLKIFCSTGESSYAALVTSTEHR